MQCNYYRILALVANGLLLNHSALASEGGGSNYIPGFYGDFAMAILPQTGTYFYNFFNAYRGRTGDTSTLLEMPGVEHVSDTWIFGGRYFAGFFPALMGVWDHSDDSSRSRVGLGDFYLLPAGLSWNWGEITATAFEGIIAPTGYYQNGAINPGRNIWTFDHNLMLTWSLPAQNELSVTFGFMNNLENHATHYRSGDEFHFDYSLGHYLADGLALGIVGSYYKQVTADHALTSLENIPYSEASTIGPAVLFTPRIGNETAISPCRLNGSTNLMSPDGFHRII